MKNKPKVLTLNLNKEYFEEIKRFEKKEEYRLCNEYWKARIENNEFEKVVIKLGYPKSTEKEKILEFEYKGYEVKKIKHKLFGDKPVEVFAIKLTAPYKKIKLEDYEGEYLIVDGYEKCVLADKDEIEEFLEREELKKEEVVFFATEKTKISSDMAEEVKEFLYCNYDLEDEDFNEAELEELEKAVDKSINKSHRLYDRVMVQVIV